MTGKQKFPKNLKDVLVDDIVMLLNYVIKKRRAPKDLVKLQGL